MILTLDSVVAETVPYDVGKALFAEMATDNYDNPATPRDDSKRGLWSRSFFGLASVQFLTSLNDNTYRWLIVPIGDALYGAQHKGLILTFGLAFFVLPYLLLVAPAGYLADRFSKRSVIGGTMLLQATILVLGMVAILVTSPVFLFLTLFFMGAQGALLSPSKGGAVPETVFDERISAANGIIGMATVMASVVGSVLGNMLYAWTVPAGKHHWWISATTLIGISLLGWAASLLIIKCAAADPQRDRPRHLFAETMYNLRTLYSHRRLFAASSANGFLWFLAALSQVNVYLLGTTSLHVAQQDVGLLLAALAAGVAVGSVTAGVWSGRTIELGLVPLGAAGITATAIMMFIVSDDINSGIYGGFYWSGLYLLLMGFSAGLYAVPLQAYLQYASPTKNRGQILSANNFISFSAMLTASFLFWVIRSLLNGSAGVIFLAAGLITLLVFVALIIALPRQTVRAILKPIRLFLPRKDA